MFTMKTFITSFTAIIFALSILTSCSTEEKTAPADLDVKESAPTTIALENTTSVDYTESQNFGEEVFRALREGDYEKMEKFLPTSSDLVYFEGVFLNENSTESERQNIKDELSEVQKNRISESKSLFEDARLEVLDQGMSWNDIKFKKIELSDVRLNGELVYRANILIHFDYFGAEHILELDDCLKAERTWLFGDGVILD
jgi:hypothetical protein